MFGFIPYIEKNLSNNRALWFTTLILRIENAWGFSFGILNRCTTLARLIAVSEVLKWKYSLSNERKVAHIQTVYIFNKICIHNNYFRYFLQFNFSFYQNLWIIIRQSLIIFAKKFQRLEIRCAVIVNLNGVYSVPAVFLPI